MAINFKLFSRVLSTKTLTGKAALNSFASGLDYGARVVVGFLINPLLLNGLGSYGYGVWQVLGRLIGYATPAGGRPTQALKWTIANKQASTDYAEKRRYVGNAVVVWVLFLPLLASLGGLLAWFAPLWLDVPEELSLTVRFAAGLLVMDLVMRSLVDVPQSVLTGENLAYKRMGLSAVLVFVGAGLTVLALHFEAGLIGVAAAALTTTLMTGGLFLKVTRTHVPWFGIARPAFKAVLRFVRLSGWFLVWNLVMKLIRASDVVLLGICASVELVTIYSLTKYVPETIIELVAIVVLGITPGLGGIIGSGHLKKAAQLRAEIMTLTWLITTVVGTTVLLWNYSFVQLWVGREYDAGPISTLLIILMVTQFVLIRNDANIIDLTLDMRRKVLTGLLSVTLSLTIAGILVGSFDMGITGLCLGFMAGRTVMSICYPWLVGRFLDISFCSQLKAIVRPFLITLLLLGLVSSHESILVVNTWPGLVLSVGLTLVLISLFAFFAGLSRERRSHVLQRFLLVTRLAG